MPIEKEEFKTTIWYMNIGEDRDLEVSTRDDQETVDLTLIKHSGMNAEKIKCVISFEVITEVIKIIQEAKDTINEREEGK